MPSDANCSPTFQVVRPSTVPSHSFFQIFFPIDSASASEIVTVSQVFSCRVVRVFLEVLVPALFLCESDRCFDRCESEACAASSGSVNGIAREASPRITEATRKTNPGLSIKSVRSTRRMADVERALVARIRTTNRQLGIGAMRCCAPTLPNRSD